MHSISCLKKFSDSILIVSYSSNSQPTQDEMVALMSKYKEHVEVVPIDYTYSFGNQKHAKTNRNKVQEYLFVGFNREDVWQKQKLQLKKITQNAWECTKIFKTGEIEKRIVKDPIDIWSIGNTGVRNPWRIPGGYKVYVESNQVGKIRTAQEQKLFKEKLLLAGEIGGDPKKDADASITRKYRLMFNKYGFAYPEVLKKDGFSQKEIGKIDDITPAGWAFLSCKYYSSSTRMLFERASCSNGTIR